MEINLGVFDWGSVAALSSIVIAILGFVINHRLHEISRRSGRHEHLAEFRKEITAFSADFLTAASEAQAFAQCIGQGAVNVDDARKKAAQLSALVDRGRFLFPNYLHENDRHGAEKGPAVEGYRREPLDAIMAAYFAMESIARPEEAERYLWRSYRELVRAGQPMKDDFNRLDPASCIFEARRSFLNSVVPSTFPREWRTSFSRLLGPVEPLSDSELDERIASIRGAKKP